MAIGQVRAGPQSLLVVLTPLVLSTGSLDHGDLGRISVWAHPGEIVRVQQALMGHLRQSK